MADQIRAAKAVLVAAYRLPLKNGQPDMAAALEALADQVVPEDSACMVHMPETDVDGRELGGMLLTTEPNARFRSDIMAIAAQLRAGASQHPITSP
jgi:hypothetical protein